MLDSLNRKPYIKIPRLFWPVIHEVFTGEVSIISVFMMQTKASGREVFSSKSSSRPVAELQVGSSLLNPTPATKQST